MSANGKVIVSAAITGAIHTPTMSPHLPFKPGDIAAQAIAAAQAGAAILHLHARDPETGRPTSAPEVFAQFLPAIKAGCDAVVNITTGGGLTMTVDQRIAGALSASPEMASLNMGSMNFGLYPLARRHDDWSFDWEKSYLEESDDYVFRNTFRDIAKIHEQLGVQHSTRFEHECYDVGHIYSLAHCMGEGMFKPPVFVQFVMGVLGGIGPAPENLLFMKQTADRLIGPDNYRWSVLAAGRSQIPLATQAILLGGNVRVGLEDSLYIGPGELAAGSDAQVAKVRRLAEELGAQIAQPDEARSLLGLKGSDRTAF